MCIIIPGYRYSCQHLHPRSARIIRCTDYNYEAISDSEIPPDHIVYRGLIIPGDCPRCVRNAAGGIVDLEEEVPDATEVFREPYESFEWDQRGFYPSFEWDSGISLTSPDDPAHATTSTTPHNFDARYTHPSTSENRRITLQIHLGPSFSEHYLSLPNLHPHANQTVPTLTHMTCLSTTPVGHLIEKVCHRFQTSPQGWAFSYRSAATVRSGPTVRSRATGDQELEQNVGLEESWGDLVRRQRNRLGVAMVEWERDSRGEWIGRAGLGVEELGWLDLDAEGEGGVVGVELYRA